MNVANGSISLLGQNCAHSVVAPPAEDDRVLCRDHLGEVGVHRVVPVGEERLRGLGDPVEGQQLVHDDLSHADTSDWSRSVDEESSSPAASSANRFATDEQTPGNSKPLRARSA